MENIDKQILEEIRRIREEKKISRKEFAEKLGLPERTYIDLETFRSKKVPADVILKGCILLNIDIRRFTHPELYNEEVLITVNPENVGDYFQQLIKNSAMQVGEVMDLKERFTEMEKKVQENNELLKAILNNLEKPKG